MLCRLCIVMVSGVSGLLTVSEVCVEVLSGEMRIVAVTCGSLGLAGPPL